MLTFVMTETSDDGQTAGIVYTIAGSSTVTLGRSRKADMQVKSPNLSRKHLQFVPTEQGWSVEDLGSRNGMKLNGDTLKGIKPLHAGDCIQAGDCFLDIAGVSPPVKGPMQIDVANLADQTDDAPLEHVDAAKGDSLLMKLVDPPDGKNKLPLKPVPRPKMDLPSKRKRPESPEPPEPIDEDDALLLGAAWTEQAEPIDEDDALLLGAALTEKAEPEQAKPVDEDDELLLGHSGSADKSGKATEGAAQADEDDELLLGKAGSQEQSGSPIFKGVFAGAFARAFAANVDETLEPPESTNNDSSLLSQTAPIDRDAALLLDQDAAVGEEKQLDQTASIGEVVTPAKETDSPPDDEDEGGDEDEDGFLRELEDMLED